MSQDDGEGLDCLFCELLSAVDDPDDEPTLHRVAGAYDTDSDYAPAAPYICDQCLQMCIEWKVERNVLLLVSQDLPEDVRSDLQADFEEILEAYGNEYGTVVHDPKQQNALTAGEN